MLVPADLDCPAAVGYLDPLSATEEQHPVAERPGVGAEEGGFRGGVALGVEAAAEVLEEDVVAVAGGEAERAEEDAALAGAAELDVGVALVADGVEGDPGGDFTEVERRLLG